MNAHQDKLVKLIQKAGTRYEDWKVFSDFTLMLACAISTHCDLRTSEEREEQYKKTIGSYDKETQALFPQMCAELVLALTDGAIVGHYEDVLGQTFHALGVENKWKGQFFTPIHLSDVMAEISFEGFDKKVEERGFASVYEPACGAGSTILGFLNAFRTQYQDRGFDTFVVHAGDIDERCVHMCYIQLSLCGVAAIVEQRNALTMELTGGIWYTPMYIYQGWEWRELSAYHREKEKEFPQGIQEVSEKKEPPDEAAEDEEMSLF